jgi:hypothetical protein
LFSFLISQAGAQTKTHPAHRLGWVAKIESEIELLRFAYARAHRPRQQQQQGIGIALGFIVIV